MSRRDRSEARTTLADRVAAFRDEVLASSEAGDREPPGSEVFDAVLRLLSRSGGHGSASASSPAASAGAIGSPGGASGGGTLRGPPPGAPSRAAATSASASPAEVDLTLHDGIARRLAWRDSELRILTDAGEVCRRLLAAARRTLSDPDEEMEVAHAVAEAGGAAARILILLVLGRVARERAALLREELAQDRLSQAIERQREELARLERALGGNP